MVICGRKCWGIKWLKNEYLQMNNVRLWWFCGIFTVSYHVKHFPWCWYLIPLGGLSCVCLLKHTYTLESFNMNRTVSRNWRKNDLTHEMLMSCLIEHRYLKINKLWCWGIRLLFKVWAPLIWHALLTSKDCD